MPSGTPPSRSSVLVSIATPLRPALRRAAAIASGFPPNVLACMPGFKLGASLSLQIMAPQATPAASPLASVKMSGCTPLAW